MIKEVDSNSRSPGSSFPTFTQSSTSPPGSPSGGDPRSGMFVQLTMDRCDTNKNGVLEKDEWSHARRDISAADANNDGKITREELDHPHGGKHE